MLTTSPELIEESDIPEMAVDLYLMDKLKARIQLARQIDNAQHKIRKENHDKHWLKEVADAMEIELDSDLAPRCVLVFARAHSYANQGLATRLATRRVC